MQKTTKQIWIALVDDWELRGNGLGNVIDLQYRPALKLMDLYEKLGVKASFNIEVMQQLAFEKYANAYNEIRKQKDFWLKALDIMLQKGFDIQLHIHPQWHNASYDGKFWKLDKRWNITDYTPDLIERFVNNSVDYLSSISKKCSPVSFRGGGWGVCCPSRTLFEILEKRGIKMDISIVQGIYCQGESIKLDYTNLECPYFPYYPDYNDVRKVSKNRTEIVEIPTQSIPKDRFFSLKILSPFKKAKNIIFKRKDYPDFIVKDPFGFQKQGARKDVIIDLSAYEKFPHILKKSIDISIERALKQGNAGIVPLVFENHTKDLKKKQLENIESFVKNIQKKYNAIVRFVTLREIAENISLIKPIINGNR